MKAAAQTKIWCTLASDGWQDKKVHLKDIGDCLLSLAGNEQWSQGLSLFHGLAVSSNVNISCAEEPVNWKGFLKKGWSGNGGDLP